MSLIKANPEAEVRAGFEAVKAGTYPMRVKEVKDRNPEKNDLEVQLEHITPPEQLVGTAGEPLKGQPSGVFDYIMLADDKQWKLRQITEAAGLPWVDYDPVVELQGRELEVVLKTEDYQGELRNKVGRYVVPK